MIYSGCTGSTDENRRPPGSPDEMTGIIVATCPIITTTMNVLSGTMCSERTRQRRGHETPKDRMMRTRKTLQKRTRVALIAVAVASVAPPALAETHLNPYFENHEGEPNGAETARPQGVVPASSGARVGATELPLRMASHVTSRERQVPRRLPPVENPAPQAVEPQSVGTAPLLPPADALTPQVDAAEPIANRDNWLQSITSESCDARADRLLDDAYREYSVKAWASAEASAWKALELTATGIDISQRNGGRPGIEATATAELRRARIAIGEAKDFVASGAAIDGDLMAAVASAHQTPVLSGEVRMGITPTQAADQYLDYARMRLAPIAAIRVRAAQAMDLIAAIQLGRNEAKLLPEETALCLRRAALQGQPGNASLASRLGMQLADMGLHSEAEMTLRHAMALSPTPEVAETLANLLNRRGDVQSAQRVIASVPRSQATKKQTPEVVQLSPQQFAAISPALNRPAFAEASDAPQSVETQRQQSAERPSADRSAKRTNRLSATLAGFRLPFVKRATSTTNVQRSQTEPNSHESVSLENTELVIEDPLQIESRIDSIMMANEPETSSGVTPKDKKAEPLLNRVFGKMPKLW